MLTQLEPAIDNASTTLSTITGFIEKDLAPLSAEFDDTLNTADGAFARMDSAFASADQIMTTDIGPALADARATLVELNQAIARITTAIPGIVSDIRATVTDIRSAVASAAPGLRDFGQLGSEARAVIRSINTLVQQIGRDPAGFLLDERVPDYRR